LPSGALPRRVVLDASVVAAWSFHEDDTEEARKVQAALESGQLTGLAPSLMWAELQQICRRKWNVFRVAREAVEASYEASLLAGLTEVSGGLTRFRAEAWKWVKALNVGSYDAYYLALALSLELDVWTFDRSFRDAALKDPRTAGRVSVPGEDVFP